MGITIQVNIEIQWPSCLLATNFTLERLVDPMIVHVNVVHIQVSEIQFTELAAISFRTSSAAFRDSRQRR